MNSYFEIMLSLMCMMLIVTCFAVPLLMHFSKFSALAQQKGFHVYSIGNMGGAESLCEVARINDAHSQINLQCSAGILSTTAIAQDTERAIFQAGVIPQSSESFGWCSDTAFVDPANCSSYLDVAALEAMITSECAGKKSCSIRDIKSFMPTVGDTATTSTTEGQDPVVAA